MASFGSRDVLADGRSSVDGATRVYVDRVQNHGAFVYHRRDPQVSTYRQGARARVTVAYDRIRDDGIPRCQRRRPRRQFRARHGTGYVGVARRNRSRAEDICVRVRTKVATGQSESLGQRVCDHVDGSPDRTRLQFGDQRVGRKIARYDHVGSIRSVAYVEGVPILKHRRVVHRVQRVFYGDGITPDINRACSRDPAEHHGRIGDVR